MHYHEEKQDLLKISTDYAIVHCISSDFALGAGVARAIDKKYSVKKQLHQKYPDYLSQFSKNIQSNSDFGECLPIKTEIIVYNLVTKKNYWNKPTYASLQNALRSLKAQCLNNDVSKLAMPLIGCGLDRLKWENVSQNIKNVFSDMDIEVLVCKL